MTQQRFVILAPSPVLTVTVEEHPTDPTCTCTPAVRASGRRGCCA